METNRSVTIDFKIEPNDYAETLYAMTFGIQKWKRIVIFLTWFLCAMCLILTLTKIFENVSPTMYACFLLVTVIVGAGWLSMQVAIYNYKRKYRTGRNIKRRVVISDTGLVFKNRSTEESGVSHWSDVAQVKELESYYLIGINARDAVIIPKKAILTEKEHNLLIHIFSDHLENKLHLL